AESSHLLPRLTEFQSSSLLAIPSIPTSWHSRPCHRRPLAAEAASVAGAAAARQPSASTLCLHGRRAPHRQSPHHLPPPPNTYPHCARRCWRLNGIVFISFSSWRLGGSSSASSSRR